MASLSRSGRHGASCGYRPAPRPRTRARFCGQRVERGAANHSPDVHRPWPAGASPSNRPTRYTPPGPYCGGRGGRGWSRRRFRARRRRGGRAILRERPAVTFLCSPNNPTGIVEPKETVMAVLGAVQRVDGLLVVDEAYGQFADWSAVPLLSEELPLVVSRTFSKTWAMAAARLGYLLAPAWLVGELEKVGPAVPPRLA
ncbi:MAG: aminotransferase class I/II-fold pyridoxal phosphate-dependent enzyme [Acidimicrobiales bacterium]